MSKKDDLKAFKKPSGATVLVNKNSETYAVKLGWKPAKGRPTKAKE